MTDENTVLDEVSRIFAEHIVKMRKAAGMNQSQLAEAINTSQTEISRIESKQRRGSLYRLHQVANACGFEVEVTVRRIESAEGV